MPRPERLDGLLAKIEGTYGSDPTPSASTDGVRVSERLWSTLTPTYAWENTREGIATGTIYPPAPAVPQGRTVSLDIAWEVKGAGSDVEPEASPLLRACGWAMVDGTQMFTYTLGPQPHESCTIYAYAGGLLWKVVGCRGVLRWPNVPGQLGIMRFAMQGLLVTDPVASAVATITGYDSTAPLAGVNYGLTVGSWSPDTISAELNQGATLQRLDSLNATSGIREFDWSQANPQVSLSVKAPMDGAGIFDTATYNPYADSPARTARTIAWTQGSTQFNRAKLNAPGAYVKMPRHTSQDGYVAMDLTYDLTDTTTYIRFD